MLEYLEWYDWLGVAVMAVIGLTLAGYTVYYAVEVVRFLWKRGRG